jgi:NADH dehydrogenase [ubiquinone] 1 alpha subcomplex assembly factor 7
MSPLGAILRESIAHDGPMPLDTFMAVALGHSRYGYYMTRDPFGVAGDFITAPEISQMFGELIGLWAAETWRLLGAPQRVHLVELGPGRGTLMRDALRAARVSNEFCAALDVHLVETSPVLTLAQKDCLAQAAVSVTWRTSIDSVPDGPAIFIANEFFDALPVRHYVKTKDGWRQRLVGLDAQGALAFGLAGETEALITAEAPDGSVLELSPVSQLLMTQIAARIAKGQSAALVVDYGHVETGFGETLQALKKHKRVNPLDEPGEADITAHVDFAALARAASGAGAQVLGPVTQGEFLLRLGIAQRAEALKRKATEEQARDIDLALARLAAERVGQAPGMGRLFKALAIAPPGAPILPGFLREGVEP